MNIKSDATTDFISEEETQQPTKTKQRTTGDVIFWIMIMSVGGIMMWAALTHPAVKGIVAFFVFFIGLNRVDASIDYFRGIDDKKPVGEKDIL